jgi:hypothetical protein
MTTDNSEEGARLHRHSRLILILIWLQIAALASCRQCVVSSATAGERVGAE